MSNFGDRLRRLRGNRTQKEVAEHLDMPVTTLSTLENQQAIPRGVVVKKLADYYGVSLTYFYSPEATEMRATDSAREWLQTVKTVGAKDTIATFASPNFPQELKSRIAEKIKQKKNG